MNRGVTIWLTGYSGAGKTTIANHLHKKLRERSIVAETIDGDTIRQKLCKDLGYSREDRCTNIARIGFVAELLSRHGIWVIVAAISPYRDARADVRRSIDQFVEVYVRCPIKECERRDIKGLYRRARAGEIKSFTGISDPYEEPIAPEIVCDTEKETIEESIGRIISGLQHLHYL
jgi:adenylylsulfate kinase